MPPLWKKALGRLIGANSCGELTGPHQPALGEAYLLAQRHYHVTSTFPNSSPLTGPETPNPITRPKKPQTRKGRNDVQPRRKPPCRNPHLFINIGFWICLRFKKWHGRNVSVVQWEVEHSSRRYGRSLRCHILLEIALADEIYDGSECECRRGYIMIRGRRSHANLEPRAWKTGFCAWRCVPRDSACVSFRSRPLSFFRNRVQGIKSVSQGLCVARC